MAVSVAAVMRQINNYFEFDRISGIFSISGNVLHGVSGAHYAYISGSAYHDGVWEMCDGYLTGRDVDMFHDEEFDGRVWLLKPPADFLDLCAEISAYDDKNPAGAYAQESFGGYSYSRRNAGGSTAWQDVFAGRLASYRGKMFSEVG